MLYTKEEIMKIKTNITFSTEPIDHGMNGLSFQPIRLQNVNLSLAEKGDIITNGKEKLVFVGKKVCGHINNIWTTEYVFNWINNDSSKFIPYEELINNNWYFEI